MRANVVVEQSRSPEVLAAGTVVVLAAQKQTDLPPVSMWPPEKLLLHTRQRQALALAVFVAQIDEKVVGHALIEPILPGNSEWGSLGDSAATTPLQEGRLVGLGALAVLPEYQRCGVATALVRARLVWLAAHPDLIAVAAIWHDSPGSNALANALGHSLGPSPAGPLDLFIYEPAKILRYLERG
jgi:GNAT superfamily N-acetyltransferase